MVGLGLALSALSPTVAAQGKSPSVRLIAPSTTQTVSGRVTFAVEVTADGLFSLHTRVDGRDYGSPLLDLTSGSFDFVVDTLTLADGLHAVQAFAQDEFGDVGRSAPAMILVNNRRAPQSMPMSMPSPINFGNAASTSTGNTLRSATPSQNSAKSATAPERPRVETTFSDMRSEVPTICRGKDPYVNDGGGRCKNGEWVPIDPANAATVANAAASKPSTSSAMKATTDATADSSAKTSASSSSPASKGKAVAVPCSEPDPFSAAGGVGLCVGGTWLELWPAKSGRRGK
jgi:hypothetical protein